MEGNLRGIEARGYKPTEQDLKQLENKRERVMQNTVVHEKAGLERKVGDREEIKTNPNLSEKAKVAQAVASALIDEKIKDPVQRDALKAAVSARMVEREKVNMIPSVPVYDKTAPAKSREPERTGPIVERNSERTR